MFLFDSIGRMLIQRRAASKITFPSLWTNACCSHPLANQPGEVETSSITEAEVWDNQVKETVKVAAIRKLKHELGLAGPLSSDSLVHLGRIHYYAPSDSGKWGEHESIIIQSM